MTSTRQPPNEYPRRILVAVTGLSPQIVTETLYALAVAPTASAFIPTEIHLITTRSGAEKARLALLSDEPGWFHRLSRDYALPPIHFTADTIHVLEDAGGRPLEDIRSPEDNRRAADGITGIIREFTADPDCALHVSIAGGRKTMGFFLGYALSLYGRPQDKLPDTDWKQRYLVELRWIAGPLADLDETERALRNGQLLLGPPVEAQEPPQARARPCRRTLPDQRRRQPAACYSLGLRPAAVSYDPFRAPRQIGAIMSSISPGA
jgi:CRISPR-associated protein (TIGR02584 family)